METVYLKSKKVVLNSKPGLHNQNTLIFYIRKGYVRSRHIPVIPEWKIVVVVCKFCCLQFPLSVGSL